MRMQSALAMLEDHGHFAAITFDGLLATTTIVDTTLADDRVFEEQHVFPIDDDGRVDGEAVRGWLGY